VGNPTTALASWNVNAIDVATDTWSNLFADVAGDTRMMNGYLDPRAFNYNATISVTGLPNPVSSGYDVYVYFYSISPGWRRACISTILHDNLFRDADWAVR